ncbi:MAG: hypothetical protein WC868_02590 [Bacteroidales bacterium]
MKTLITISLTFFFFVIIVFGQNSKIMPDTSVSFKKDTLKNIRIPNNSFYIELLGNAPLYSLNYERIFINKNKFYLSGRIGIGYFFSKLDPGSSNIVVTPVLINVGYQLRKKFFIETGIGATYAYQREVTYSYYSGKKEIDINNSFFGTALIGLRIQGSKGFLFRVGFTPFYSINEFLFAPFGGVSFGYSF